MTTDTVTNRNAPTHVMSHPLIPNLKPYPLVTVLAHSAIITHTTRLVRSRLVFSLEFTGHSYGGREARNARTFSPIASISVSELLNIPGSHRCYAEGFV